VDRGDDTLGAVPANEPLLARLWDPPPPTLPPPPPNAVEMGAGSCSHATEGDRGDGVFMRELSSDVRRRDTSTDDVDRGARASEPCAVDTAEEEPDDASADADTRPRPPAVKPPSAPVPSPLVEMSGGSTTPARKTSRKVRRRPEASRVGIVVAAVFTGSSDTVSSGAEGSTADVPSSTGSDGGSCSPAAAAATSPLPDTFAVSTDSAGVVLGGVAVALPIIA
jgi:hypothetical protein